MVRFSRPTCLVLAAGTAALWWWRPKPQKTEPWRFPVTMVETGEMAYVQKLSSSPDGRLLAISSGREPDMSHGFWSGPAPDYPRDLQVWNVRTHTRRANLSFTDYGSAVHQGRTNLVFSKSGNELTTTNSTPMMTWNYRTGLVSKSKSEDWIPYPGEFLRVRGKSYEKFLISKDERCWLGLIRPENGKPYLRLLQRRNSTGNWRAGISLAAPTFSPQDLSSVDLSNDGKILAVGNESGSLRIFHVKEPVGLPMVRTSRTIESMAFSPDSKILLVVGSREKASEGEMSLWEIGTGRLIWKEGADEPLRCATYSATGDWVAAVEGESRVVVRRVSGAGDRPPA